MKKRPDQDQRPARRLPPPTWLFVVAGAVALLASSMAWLEVTQAGEVPAGVRLGEKSLAGMKVEAAATEVRTALASAEAEGTTLKFGEKSLVLEYAVTDAAGIGLTTDIATYDIEATVRAVTQYGSSGSPLVTGFNRLRAMLFGVKVLPRVAIDQAALTQGLINTLGPYEDPPVEPSFTLTGSTVKVEPSSSGQTFDQPAIAVQVERQIKTLTNDPIVVTLREVAPTVTAPEAETLLPEVRSHVDVGTMTLTAGEKNVTVKAAVFIEWLQAVKKGGQVSLTVDPAAVESYLTDLLPQVSTVAKNAKFTLKDGVVTQIQGSSSGRELDVVTSTKELVKAVEKKSATAKLTMRDVDPEATADTVANLGVKELVAVGKTNFAGSPANRRHNIAVGANLLNGLLIKPGEEFSLIKTIGPVDATLGYKQELVIKGDRTIPEFGGGLCQIGTTLFRAVLNAGLPVIERRNHSYRVSYYEPPVGMDATIYEPKPDFRFKNDYGTYLLLQTRIDGNDLIFEFWGTKDTRVASTTTPKVFNVVKPPAPLTIETTDIPVGTTKCIEKPHNGSDAEFTYTVVKDGKKIDTVFTSHYRPWRQVCLLGVKKLSSGTDEPKNTNSNSNTNTSSNVNTNKNTNTNATVE